MSSPVRASTPSGVIARFAIGAIAVSCEPELFAQNGFVYGAA